MEDDKQPDASINQNSSSDQWSDWLLRRRHGGDTEHEVTIRRLVQVFRELVLQGSNLAPGMTLLDVGAGDGLIAFGAFEKVGPSIRAILADVSGPLLAEVERRATALGVRSRCRFLETSAERLDGVGDETVDVLTTRAVLAYVADRTAALYHFHRVLKPGGRVSIAEPIN